MANRPRITAMATNAAGMPVRPVVWYAVGMTPAATVSGATPASTKNSTDGMPSRSFASSWDMRERDLARALVVCALNTVSVSFIGLRSDAVRQHRAVDGRLGLRDQLAQVGFELADGFVQMTQRARRAELGQA